MDLPWSDGVYTSDVPRDFEEMRMREDRKERIGQYWNLLVADQEPKVSKQTLLMLMQDLKDEGNTVFKESHYDVAWMHYRNALFIGRILETRFYHDVDKEFVSTLFSNRAFCCLKKEMYNEAIHDCEKAIDIFSSNIKAYYRQVQALKAQNRTAEALKIAQQGHLKQPNIFRELIEELSDALEIETTSKQKISTANVSVRHAQAEAANQPDADWLTGTNIHLNENSSKPKVMKKSSGKPKQQKKSKQVMNLPRNGHTFSESESEEGSSSDSSSLNEDEKFASNFLNVRKTNLSAPGPNIIKLPTPSASSTKQESSPRGKQSDSMGLDSFSAGKSKAQKTSSAYSSSSSASPVHKQPKKTVPTLSDEDLNALYFPLENYDFKLACAQCFVKTGEGVQGYAFYDFEHMCDKDYLVVKLKATVNTKNITWIRIRPRPEHKTPKMIYHYKKCLQFAQNQPCRVGDDRCTFPHTKAEMDLWEMDKDEQFSIFGFIEKLHELKIESSWDLETFIQNNIAQNEPPPARSPGIPGLNFKSKKSKSAIQAAKQQEALLKQQVVKAPYSEPVEAPIVKMPQLKPKFVSTEPPVRGTTVHTHTTQEESLYHPSGPLLPKPQHSSVRYTPPQHLVSSPVRPNLSRPPPPIGGNPGGFTPAMNVNTRFPPPRMPGPQQTSNKYQAQYNRMQAPQGGYFGQETPHYHPGPTNQVQMRPNLMRVPAPKPASEMPLQVMETNQPVTILKFPLRDTHDFKLVCRVCFVYGNQPGYYMPQQKTHKCEENVLAVKLKGLPVPWHCIRERKNHREFPGKYILCNSVYYRNPGLCRYGEESCSFAHNEEEQTLWTQEKDEKFNITEFIMQNRSVSVAKGFTLADVLKKHGGTFDFICKFCYCNTPRVISNKGSGDFCKSRGKHQWSEYKIMAHFANDGSIKLINQRGFLHKTAFFKICKWLQFCRNQINAECRFAHSLVERDIWMLERDSGMSKEEIVQELSKAVALPISQQHEASPPVDQTVIVHSASAGLTPTTLQAQKPPSHVVAYTKQNLDLEDNECPYLVTAICQTCWKNGKKSVQDGDKDRCVKSHSNWKTNRIFLLATANREIRPLPRKIPGGFAFIICKFIRNKTKCGYTAGGYCQFAHSQEELEVWQWMCTHSLSTLEQLHEASKESQKKRQSLVKSKITSGESVIAVKNVITLPIQSNFNPLYCAYCGKQCNSQKQWDEHCASERHNFNVSSDKEHQWNYRQPPWGMPGSNYELCAKNENGGKCTYSNVPDMYNMCTHAHSVEELEEWKERHEWRLMKREMARQEMVFSYMDQLLEKYEQAESAIGVISEEQDGVSVTCNQDLVRYEENKNVTFLWTFNIKSQLSLQKLALLYNKDRLHFSLVGKGLVGHCQIAQGTSCEEVDLGEPCYRVQVKFTAAMFGSFSQWVIFDFGREPVLVRKLSVEVGTMHMHEKIRTLRQQLQFDRWTSENRVIVKNEAEWVDDLEKMLTNKYKAPSAADSVVTQNSLVTELNRNNYIHKMKKLLELEEITRHQVIAEYNLEVTIDCVEGIQEETYLYAHQGELFAKVPLNDYLTEDTDAGKLILSSVRKILIAPTNNSSKTVFEAAIVRKDNFDYDGRGKEYIYLCLSKACVSQLNLKKNMSIEVEIQFQMDRMHFCMMHFAIDKLQTTDVVFPDISKYRPLWSERHDLKVSSDILNVEQIQAVKHIVAQRSGYTPPFVMYGPFGTGKTETIAQAAMVLLKEKPSARILICAQSNSAADLYILKHLGPFLKKHPKIKLRRIYFKERRINTVNRDVKPFCLLTPDCSAFGLPTREDIEHHQIVIVTLATSLVLTNLGLHGHFSHVFIDEAAQALEVETIMPLSLCNEKTCVVLAGDHKQISPKVYSQEARNQKFDISLLERLYQYYDSHSAKIDQASPVNILLNINYRSKHEILRFISAIFYGGPDKLESQAKLPSVLTITPLTFYAVQGRETQDTDSTSFYNLSEIQEIVERVEDLFHNWPHEWGPRQAKEIGVVTPYYDQVQLIRKSLRKRHKELGSVTVERVNNVQGKEFRALFLSTVRTCSILESQTTAGANAVDDSDFGFLSDPKLLNTALTRAQSFVAVIGDPVALCAVGECVNVWRVFLKHCDNMKSIHPPTVTLNSVKQQVSNLLNSSAKDRMMEIVSQQRQHSNQDKDMMQSVPPSTEAQWEVPAGNVAQILNGHMNGLGTAMQRQTSFEDYLSNLDVEDLADAEDVILQLAKETAGCVSYSDFKIKEEDERAILYVDEPGNDEQEDEIYPSIFNEKNLQNLLKVQPNQFKLCTLRVISRSKMYAEVHDSLLPYSKIIINTRQHCGRAFDMDDVVVQLSSPDAAEPVDGCPQGKVVGVLRRSIDIKNRLFVCTASADNTGLMWPINQGIPCIYNLLTSTNSENVDNNLVCVYRYSQSKTLGFHEAVELYCSKPSDKLFVVQYLKWDPTFSLPIGVVVGYIPAGTTVDLGLQVLNVEYNIPRRVFKTEVEGEINSKYPRTYTIPDHEIRIRHDIRQDWTFSIDSPGVESISNALSVDELGDGSYRIGVHVADVGYYVKKDGIVDKEARSRGTAFSTPNSTVNIIPERLGSELCSLKPGEDHLTLSVYMDVSAAGEICKIQLKKSVINTKIMFTYQEVQETLNDPGAGADYLKSCLLVLYHICMVWRKERLGNASKYHDLKTREKLTPEAHLIVQEIMLKTDHQVAKMLVDKFPNTTPLKCQKRPKSVDRDQWMQEYAADAVNSIALTKPFLEGSSTCNCKLACTCIMNYIRQLGKKPRDPFEMLTVLWESLCHAADAGEIAYSQSYVIEPEYHPQLMLALSKLHEIQNPPVFVCSGDITETDQEHSSLNLSPYVSFTKPISRYVDLVVTRLLTAVIEDQPSVYSCKEIQSLCIHLTAVSQRSDSYDKAVHSLYLSSALKARPLVLHPIIQNLDQNDIQLCFQTIGDIPRDKSRIHLPSLHTSKKPAINDNASVKLTWQDRIYDVSTKVTRHVSSISTEVLNPSRFISRIPAFQWQRLLSAIREENMQKLQSAVTQVRPHVKQAAQSEGYVLDVSVGNKFDDKIKHYADFTMTLSTCDVVQVQMSAHLHNGLITPSLQLLGLTPSLEVCLEHRDDPLACFSHRSIPPADNTAYPNVASYQQLWLPILGLESTHNAVKSGQSVVVKNLCMAWKEEKLAGSSKIVASFTVPLTFCMERQFIITNSFNLNDIFSPGNAKLASSFFQNCVCVRYNNLDIADDPSLRENVALLVNNGMPICWVGHCQVVSVSRVKDNITVNVVLVHSSSTIPSQLLGPQASNLHCTLEWIPKTTHDRLMEYSVQLLTEASQLAHDIISGRVDGSTNNGDVETLLQLLVTGMPRLADDQVNAVRMSLQQRFTAIQGPVASGKSLVASYLAYLFSRRNANVGLKHLVLLCGPTDQSVDVLTANLKNLGKMCPKILRVYSDEVEEKEFPIPGSTVPSNEQKPLGEEFHSPSPNDTSLHHVIRLGSNSYSQTINEYDMLFKMYPDDISSDQVEEYCKMKSDAETAEICRAEIILCTCDTVASAKLSNIAVEQIIIDDCGMCTEAEAITPVIHHASAKQVTILGDAIQLPHKVNSPTAKTLGLTTSLLQRYIEKALVLNKYFRMHERIASFPCEHFYENTPQRGSVEQLAPGKVNIWPGGPNQPFVFCHVLGKEEAVTVKTDRGLECSYLNNMEVNIAVTTACKLVSRHGVPESKVIVLAQYQVQCEAIKRMLLNAGHKNIKVSDVLSAHGGEWEYVIYSTVRSLPQYKIDRYSSRKWCEDHLGVSDDHCQVHVALTRANKGIVIIGNKFLLRSSYMWTSLLKKYEECGAVVDSQAMSRLLG
ncbi:helicase with zinc finger domain 2-like [Mizuhopecten yessoensis]|uniref:Helicase with zinc finger domain n=1 Tax=Mizuhopecten yessoensis TaxID=6573 RepID=A0A210QWX0_MIZYE|nr:helicase with zinc finger domain 2-like [Mizuhopecten yessoensis]OWF53235.1 helicase with zinc finger domain [Mizuhopecten yessoensis]